MLKTLARESLTKKEWQFYYSKYSVLGYGSSSEDFDQYLEDDKVQNMEDIFTPSKRRSFTRGRMSLFNSPRRKPINAIEVSNLNKEESDYEFSSSSAS